MSRSVVGELTDDVASVRAPAGRYAGPCWRPPGGAVGGDKYGDTTTYDSKGFYRMCSCSPCLLANRQNESRAASLRDQSQSVTSITIALRRRIDCLSLFHVLFY